MIFIKSKVTLKFVKSGIGNKNLSATIEDMGLKKLVNFSFGQYHRVNSLSTLSQCIRNHHIELELNRKIIIFP